VLIDAGHACMELGIVSRAEMFRNSRVHVSHVSGHLKRRFLECEESTVRSSRSLQPFATSGTLLAPSVPKRLLQQQNAENRLIHRLFATKDAGSSAQWLRYPPHVSCACHLTRSRKASQLFKPPLKALKKASYVQEMIQDGLAACVR
jgi:hypothetical protein